MDNVFSPILARREYLGAKAEPVTAHLAHVLVTSKGEHRIVWPHDRAHSVVWQHTRSKGMFRGKVKTVYDIDLGVRHLPFEVELPGAGDTFSFNVSVVVEWRVLDPSLVVRSQLLDIRPLIQPVITEEMRRIAREYGVDNSAAAETAINERLAGEALNFNDPEQLGAALARTVTTGHIGREYGLWTRTIASVQPDKSRLAQSDEVRDLRHQIEAERLKQELRMLQEQNNQQVLENRTRFYREAFTSGDIERAVLQVAQNPEELTAVAQVVREQELAGQRLTIDFVNKLLEEGAIERWQVNDQAKAALDWLRQSTSAVFTPEIPGQASGPAGQQRKRVRKTPPPELGAGTQPDTTIVVDDVTPDRTN
ncbi:SPFH domain-containing protein [Catenulispora pinisilvae]|uniref:SPFH domain-containing protein n=1 Tax=Catenulispora pinisilvae TaxID=2705253 RepID=UPI001891DA9A|nr:SPFH domain-containing protein [Catenulispora pinisilvae]